MRHISALLVSILSLPLFAEIAGTVMTADGVAIRGARVSIHAFETSHARRARLLSRTPDAVSLASAETDASGTFSLPSPKEPVVELRVELRGYDPFVRRVEREEAPVAAALVKSEMRKGSVTAGGKPVANALVMLDADYVTRSDAQGSYEIPALRRTSVLAVIHPDYAIDATLLPASPVSSRELMRTLRAGVTLTGRAVAADGTSPFAGAEISVDGWPLAVSGEDGAFTIAHAPATWTTITARKGSLTGSHTAGGAKTIIVRLEPLAVVSGRVRDAKTNQPLAGAVIVLGPTSTLGADAPEAITDAAGTYSILLAAGSASISSSHPAYATGRESIRIAPGEQRTHDFALTQLARVTGAVVDHENRPIPAAMISPQPAAQFTMLDMEAMNATPVAAGPDGKFSVRVVPGHDFHLHVARKGLPKARSGVMKVAAGERKGGVVVTVPAGVAVTGRVLDARGKPLSGVSVLAGPAARPGAPETLDTVLGPRERDPIRSAADGRFAIRLEEGTYNFWFMRDGYLARKVAAQRVVATGRNTLEARLDPAVEISGRVTRGGVGIAGVELDSDGLHATTASDGSFILGGLSPGVKQLRLMKRTELIFENRSVTAPAHGVTIDLRPGGTIRGRVVEKGTKRPVRSFHAAVLVGPSDQKHFSSEDGSFTLEHVPAGPTTITIEAFGYLDTHLDVDVADGKSLTDLVVELEPGVRLTGKVTDVNGAPLSGATIRIGPAPAGGIGGIILGGPWNAKREKPAPSNSGATTVTDANGRYTLDGLVPREESVSVSHPAYIEVTRQVTLEGREAKLDVQLSPRKP